MNKLFLSVAVMAAIGFTSCKNEAKQEVKPTTEVSQEVAMADLSFGVRGNCGMCKKTIEKAAKKLLQKQLDPQIMIDAMVELIPQDVHPFRNVVPEALGERCLKYEKEQYELKCNEKSGSK